MCPDLRMYNRQPATCNRQLIRKSLRLPLLLRHDPGRPPDLARLGEGCAFAARCSYRTDVCDAERPALTMEGARGFACFNPVGQGA